jgi:hypothetical protein
MYRVVFIRKEVFPVEKPQRMSTMVSGSLKRQFKAWCAVSGVTMNDVLREMLEQKLGPQGQQSGTKTTKAAKTARGEVRA